MHATGVSFVLPLVLAAAAAAGTARDAVEMEVLGVVPLEADAASLLLLRQKGEQTVLPIFVGRAEGAAIDQRLRREQRGRAGAGASADLLENTIAALGAKVTRVDIESASAAAFRARVSLVQGHRHLDVEARPSDSVALALSARVPIFASRAVVAEAGLSGEELTRLGRARDGDATQPGTEERGAVQSF